jgi:hypothetical protein
LPGFAAVGGHEDFSTIANDNGFLRRKRRHIVKFVGDCNQTIAEGNILDLLMTSGKEDKATKERPQSKATEHT